MKGLQQLYVYVDESGQDPSSEVFVVVAVVSAENQEALREYLLRIEKNAGTGRKKWHKVRHTNRMQYLTETFNQRIAGGGIYVGAYQKVIPYFFPMLDILERSIKHAGGSKYWAHIYVDGIDKYKAKQLTNALRAKGVALGMVKNRRDESEPLIRLADMWAGCVRSALLRHPDTQKLFEKAKKAGYVRDLSPS